MTVSRDQGPNLPADMMESFVVARFAQWAGDFDHAMRRFREAAGRALGGDAARGQMSPENVLRLAAMRRHNQLVRRRREFNDVAALVSRDGLRLTYQPTILKTVHLRGAIWTVAEGEFELRAYLSTLKWEKRLFEKVRALTSTKANAPADNQQVPPSRRVIRGRGGTWREPGDLATVISVDDLGLIEGRGLWTLPSLPEVPDAVATIFQAILNRLDEPGPSAA